MKTLRLYSYNNFIYTAVVTTVIVWYLTTWFSLLALHPSQHHHPVTRGSCCLGVAQGLLKQKCQVGDRLHGLPSQDSVPTEKQTCHEADLAERGEVF